MLCVVCLQYGDGLYCERVFLLLCDSRLYVADAGLSQDVTDSGLRALASAGCGAQLSSLILAGGWHCGDGLLLQVRVTALVRFPTLCCGCRFESGCD